MAKVCEIQICCDNAAFEDGPGDELARILRHCAKLAENGDESARLMDANGNKVGRFEVFDDGE